MSDISPQRINIQQEEVAYRASVSEATLSRVGAGINFVNERQYDSRGFFLNGPYATVGGSQTGVDGAWGVLFNVRIVGVLMFNLVSGTSGTTTLDIRRFTGSNTPTGGASIFGTKPAIASTASNNAYVFRDFKSGVTLEGPTGTTVPTLAIDELNAGDLLTLNLDAAQGGGAENCGLILYYIPR